MFWDLFQQAHISQAKWTADDAKSVARDAQSENRFLKGRIQRLEETVERISLATMAVAEILQERMGIGMSEIEARIHEIDLRDGKLDGRLRTPAEVCEHCHQTNAPNRRKCLYCGKSLPIRPFVPPANEING